MARTPGRYDIVVQRRADHQFDAKFKDSDGNLINLTGCQILAQVWNPNRTQKIGDFIITILNAVDGTVRFKIPFAVTTVLPYDSRYDVLIITPSGLREYYLEGLIQASEGYTSL
jgi:hypothetical protein